MNPAPDRDETDASAGLDAGPDAHGPIVEVVLDVPVARAFDYLAADATPTDVGHRALVPFGSGHRMGVIVAVRQNSTVDIARLRRVDRILRDAVRLAPDELAFFRFCADYYQYPLGQVILSALPPALRKSAAPPLPVVSGLRASAAGLAALAHLRPSRSAARAALVSRILQGNAITRSIAAELGRGAVTALREFTALGWLEPADTVVDRGQPAVSVRAPPELLPDQHTAVERVRHALDSFAVFLLAGVTGSGKTEVYLRLIETVLARGRQVLVLVPEISLTPQLEARFADRFPGAELVSLHSRVADVERARRWLRAREPGPRIVLGTRLAVFVGLAEPGLFVVDEEHDPSFKQQDGLRYSARDLAVLRAKRADVPVLLGSATPSLESWFNASSGRYTLLDLPRRAVQNAALPTVRLVDTRSEALDHGLGPTLCTAIEHRLARGEQTLVFVNRRGYAPVLLCRRCGWSARCDRCSARLVLHAGIRQLHCHHCGKHEPVTAACPACGHPDLRPFGHGTQRLEDALTARFPQARILRIDRDSMARQGAFEDAIDAVHGGRVDIVIGTQMLAKGHDFPGITLVGMVDVDSALYSPDFRAEERLFALLVQVAGRAGRAARAGEVIIQTTFPEHPLLAAVRAQDYRAFAGGQLADREMAGFPPFVHQAILRVESIDAAAAEQFTVEAAAVPDDDPAVTVFDPVPAVMARLAGRTRWQLLVQSDSRPALQGFLSRWRERLGAADARKVRWAIDVDPCEL